MLPPTAFAKNGWKFFYLCERKPLRCNILFARGSHTRITTNKAIRNATPDQKYKKKKKIEKRNNK